jgi:hypothetical protein
LDVIRTGINVVVGLVLALGLVGLVVDAPPPPAGAAVGATGFVKHQVPVAPLNVISGCPKPPTAAQPCDPTPSPIVQETVVPVIVKVPSAPAASWTLAQEGQRHDAPSDDHPDEDGARHHHHHRPHVERDQQDD